MAAILAWARLDLRRRWRSLVVLALLTMVSAAVVLTAAAGAHRGGTAADRLREVTLPADVFILPNERGFDWAEIERLPYVEALAQLAITDPIVPVGDYDPGVVGYPTLDDQLLRTIEKPVVLEGRSYDPTKVGEVVVTPEFVRRYGKGVGDSLTMALAAPNQIYDEPEPADKLNGPRVPVTIVGVIRTPYNFDLPGRPGLLLVSPALTTAYSENIIGPAGKVGRQTVVNAQARLTHGAADIPQLRRDLQRLSGRGDIDVVGHRGCDRVGKHTSAFESTCLWAFAAIALLATLFLVGQALGHGMSPTPPPSSPRRGPSGCPPGRSSSAPRPAPVLAVVAGLVAALGVSVLASQRFPIGVAGAVEPDPGIDVDVLVLGRRGAADPGACSSWWQSASALGVFPRHHGDGSAAALGGREPGRAVHGCRCRWSSAPGSPSRRAGARPRFPHDPALLGAVIGVIGVVGVIAFDAGITDALDDPERVGQTAQVLAFHGFAGYGLRPGGLRAATPSRTSTTSSRSSTARFRWPATRRQHLSQPLQPRR